METCSVSAKEASQSNLKNARCLCWAEKTLEVILRFYPIVFCSYLAPDAGRYGKTCSGVLLQAVCFQIGVVASVAAKSIRGVRLPSAAFNVVQCREPQAW